MTNMNRKAKRGITLVEIAIVLAVIGLLLGGVLKGQELINNAKVRSIAERQSSLQVAWYAFVKRYKALPGDYTRAAANIPGAANGDGNGRVRQIDSPLAFQHLTAAGYLRCRQCRAVAPAVPQATNSLKNQYGGIMSIWHADDFYATLGGTGSNTRPRLAIHTGQFIPSNVLKEVDIKLDDGIANTGNVVFSEWLPTGLSLAGVMRSSAGQCMAQGEGATTATATGGATVGTTANFWRGSSADPPVQPDCAAAVFL